MNAAGMSFQCSEYVPPGLPPAKFDIKYHYIKVSCKKLKLNATSKETNNQHVSKSFLNSYYAHKTRAERRRRTKEKDAEGN